ncbi:MAG: hypothetical protein F2842_05955 [Actinobacteria bacterium]|uniref:Unannotated protein n=1 Tax=freshwater metagenome TaxID=449393 RepID=A0A6J7JU18_9ZZZZ|nr:hypothetical protein [Actinomycetota bacterium]
MSAMALLAGVTVVDLSTRVPARLASRLLSDLGAKVMRPSSIVVDGPELGAEPKSRAAYTSLLDHGKVELQAEGVDDLWAGLSSADAVVLDEGSPDVWALLESMPASRPGTVTVTPFGSTGRRSGWRGGDLIAQASGGLLRITGDSDRQPMPLPPDVTHGVVGVQVAIALVSIVRSRRLGTVNDIDLSVQDGVVGILEGAVTPAQMAGTVRERMGTMHPSVHGIGLQRTRDGQWVLFGTCPRPAMWDALADVLGRPEWSANERWLDARLRREDSVEVDEAAAPTIEALDLDDFYGPMLARGVPVGVVNDLHKVLSWDQIVQREFIDVIDGPEGRRDLAPGVVPRLASGNLSANDTTTNKTGAPG